MTIDQKTMVALLIGLVIGGLVIGSIDANRPKPLFSSANEFYPMTDGNNDLTSEQEDLLQSSQAMIDELKRYGGSNSSSIESSGIWTEERCGRVWDQINALRPYRLIPAFFVTRAILIQIYFDHCELG